MPQVRIKELSIFFSAIVVPGKPRRVYYAEIMDTMQLSTAIQCHALPSSAIQCHPKQRYERGPKTFFLIWRTEELSISAGCCRTSDGHDMKKRLMSDSIVLIFQKHVFSFPFAK